MEDHVQEIVANIHTPIPPEVLENKPFAKLRIGDRTFFIANADTDESLMFRTEDADTFKRLENTLEAGWHSVAGEILIATRDALQEYVKMHLINLSGEDSIDDWLDMDLFDYRWRMWHDVTGDEIVVELPERGIVHVDLMGVPEFATRRDAAVFALVNAAPGLAIQFKDEIFAWAKRLAAGAIVEPVM